MWELIYRRTGWDVAVHPTGETLHVGLDEKSVDGLVRKLRDPGRRRFVVMEATGGYEAELSAAIWTAGVPSPSSTRATSGTLARSQGILAKTDRIDAAVIARFGEAATWRPGPPCLMRCGNSRRSSHARRQVTRMRTSEQLRRRQALPAVRKSIEEVIAFLDLQLKEIDDDLGRRLRESPLWQDQAKLLRSVPGIGPVATFSLLADLPELGPSTGGRLRRSSAWRR